VMSTVIDVTVVVVWLLPDHPDVMSKCARTIGHPVRTASIPAFAVV
jgi:hypothetical protein